MNKQTKADLKKENDILKNRVEILENKIRELMERDVFVQREKYYQWANIETFDVYSYLVNNHRHFYSKLLTQDLGIPLQIKEYLTDVFDDKVRLSFLHGIFNVPCGYYIIRDLFNDALDRVDLVQVYDAIKDKEYELKHET